MLIVWFNASGQLSTTQPLAHFPRYLQRDGVGEERKSEKKINCGLR